MTYPMTTDTRLDLEIERRRAAGRAYAVATVVRTVSSTSAKPGAKALLDEDGAIVEGFLGGGCIRGAVGRAARDAIATGEPQFLSLKPGDLLDAEGVTPGEERDGVRYARNGCPSRGSMDVFVEPVLPKPRLVICGAGVVALALAELSDRFEFHRTLCLPAPQDATLPVVDRVVADFEDGPAWEGAPYVVVATQGKGDEAALRRALARPASYVAFVGSRRKFAALADKLRASGVAETDLARVHAPAGLDIKAITPDEIALSILAQMVQHRRSAARQAGGDDG